jgi:hypothetical protein
MAAVSLQRTVSRFLVHQGLSFLTKNNMTVIPHPSYSSLFPQLKVKLNSRRFNTIEVIKAESQTMLNTLTEHDFQNAFKNDSAG